MIHIIALQNLVSNCIFNWVGTEWDGLEWQDPRPQPTREAWEAEKTRLIEQAKQDEKLAPIRERQSKIQALLLATDYIELPSFLERKGQKAFQKMYDYRTALRNAYHNPAFPIPEVPEI
jgi:hypothetical protein